jgi:hypothetical protein
VAGLGSQIAEHGLRVLVAAFSRRAGETDERSLRQRIAHMLGEAVNEIVLAAVRFVIDRRDVRPHGNEQAQSPAVIYSRSDASLSNSQKR